MPACDSKPWTMTLILDRDPTQKDELRFLNVRIVFGVIVGEVHNSLGKISDLIGRCAPFVGGGVPGVSEMNFVFRFNPDIGIFLTGLAFEPAMDPKPLFRGRFFAFPADASTPSIGEEISKIVPDVGDTGTGNGMQT